MLGTRLDPTAYIAELGELLAQIDTSDVSAWADAIHRSWQEDRYVYFAGNGGAANTAAHMVEDLATSLLPRSAWRDESRRRLKVLSLCDNPGWITAIANDLDFEQVFVQQLMNLGREGDLLVAISGSGNSPNVLAAVEWSHRHGLRTFALTGYDGGKLRSAAQAGLHVPAEDMGLVQSVHLALFHWVLDDLHARVNQLGRYA